MKTEKKKMEVVVFSSSSLSGIIECVQLFIQRKCLPETSVECLKEMQQWEDLGADERVILNGILMK